MTVRWQVSPFAALDGATVYAMLQLRQQVFVVEQRCAFLDADGIDPACHHVLGWEGERLVATARVVPAGLVNPELTIGRVVSAPEVRGQGVGRRMMEVAIDAAAQIAGDVPIYLWAQAYLERLYGSLGFEVCGPAGEEDGIPHLPMRRPARRL